MALDVKPSDKLIMMLMMPGFLYAVHHPEEDYGSWDLKVHRSNSNTFHIAQAVQEGISHTEVITMLEDALKETDTKPTDFKYNNISGRYRTVIKKAFT